MYFIEMGMCAITPYTPEVYPLHIRVLGTSTAMGVGRIGGATGPYIIGLLMGIGKVPWIWIVLGAGCLIAGLATIWLGIETRGRNLEQLNPVAAERAAAMSRRNDALDLAAAATITIAEQVPETTKNRGGHI
jgi:MFS family permease